MAQSTLSSVPCICADPVLCHFCSPCLQDDVAKNSFNIYRGEGCKATSHSTPIPASMCGCVLQLMSCRWRRVLATDLSTPPAAYVHLFGREAQLKLIERISHFERRRAELLAELPQHLQQVIAARQSSACEEPGAEKWVFPDAILDEAATIAQWDAP